MLARNYIGKEFNALRMLRLFLPARDSADLPLSWSSILPLGFELTASTDCNELVSGYLAEHPGAVLPAAPLGRLARETANALREILGSWVSTNSFLHTRSWVGYSPPFTDQASTSFFVGREYLHEEIGLEEIIFHGVRDQVPAFVEDPSGSFAWGTGLYPDSLIVAAVPELFMALHQDPRLEIISTNSSRDVLPAPFEG
ncbi:hypothetical protein CQ018_13415 [Arthrobacter sp. MYb227]|uniref:hypothetical protein n=1 Tax=Arthrobacter sp. MYb227 TaxID=1848601 RepID=UPI000CFB6B1B|nr:hypothetical protein [Arthrobacter sp. MYb227]PQZ91630.1 hypothetical protein CQ018_13415 [Arthrobacter sp. MYb227]